MRQFTGNKKKLWLVFSIVIIIMVCISINHWWAGGSKPPMSQAIPVTVDKVQQETVTIDLTAVGKVHPYSTVSVRAQVEGPIIAIDFQRGQDVKVGDMLFTIDPRPYEVALQQAEANLAKEKALLTDATADLQRLKPLLSKKYISQENYDTAYSTMLAQEAAVRGAEANVADAQLNLDYCTIRSPIDGRTGDVLVHLGNLVKANDAQPLVIINQIRPIFVSFDVPEQFLPAINRRLAEGNKIAVTVTDVNEQILAEQGELFFVDNTIDTQTGTIELKANFNNANDELWPGQFVNVELGLYTLNNAIIIPTRAIQHGQKGSYVFVVNAANKAEYRAIQTNEVIDNNTVVTQGLDVNELVVVDGQFRLADGSDVTTAP